MKTTECKYCGKKIQFAQTEKGYMHPFDTKPTLGLVLIETNDGTDARYAIRKIFVSHFATCKAYKK